MFHFYSDGLYIIMIPAASRRHPLDRTSDLLSFGSGANNRSTFTVFDARGIDRSHFPTAARVVRAASGRKSPRPLDRKSTRPVSVAAIT